MTDLPNAAEHATVVLERVYDASPSQVFSAYADVQVRARWGIPSEDDAIVYSESNFRVGGDDAYRCGRKGDLKYIGAVRYHDIVPDQRIVFTESVAAGGRLLAVSLITWEVRAEGTRSHLWVTDQIVSLEGADMIKGTRAGTAAALDNLGRWLAKSDTTRRVQS